MQRKHVTHTLGDGKVLKYVRLTAEPGKVLTHNRDDTWNCVDVLEQDVEQWTETDAPPDPVHYEDAHTTSGLLEE